ncbi:hypothetical protein D9758_011700 [Tetrapyrgos nigripes]|uniref:Ion transport domain-containing protein n=1 Tax=Tetrapyrgos nigripes TaxID=182062 RepID=A0A8H5LM79_9AGAR|nr:hypothetical protein D9758_011700 [Tetrapyrgos nigripes]
MASSYQNPFASYFLIEDHPPPTPVSPRRRPPSSRRNDDEDDPHNDHDPYSYLSLMNLPPWKRDLHLLLEHPTSSTGATLIHILMTFFILASAVVTVLETVPALRGVQGGAQIWFGIETTLVAIFTVEYIARCVAWSGSWMSLLRWGFSFFALTDLLSVLPYYIEILLHQDTSSFFRFSILRMFRLLRVFRPFRWVLPPFFPPVPSPSGSPFGLVCSCTHAPVLLSPYNHTILLTIEVMYLSVRRSQHALAAIGFFVVCVMSVWSTVLYFVERGTWDPVLETFINAEGDPSQFSSIPAAGWFVLVTITTVGYGEITPRSFLGRLLTLPLLVFGLLLIALPSFVLGREFAIVWEGMTGSGGGGVKEASSLQPLPNRQPLTRAQAREEIFNAGADADIDDDEERERQQDQVRDRDSDPLFSSSFPSSSSSSRRGKDKAKAKAPAMGTGTGYGYTRHDAIGLGLGIDADTDADTDIEMMPRARPSFPRSSSHPRPHSSLSTSTTPLSMTPSLTPTLLPTTSTSASTSTFGVLPSGSASASASASASVSVSAHTSRSATPTLTGSATPNSSSRTSSTRDLSNRKLAQNQTELSRQISLLQASFERREEGLQREVGELKGTVEGLRGVVERQGEMIGRLVGLLEGVGVGGVGGLEGKGEGEGGGGKG